MTYLELLQKNLVDEIEATRSYAATMAVAPLEDIPVLLELLADETDHMCPRSYLRLQATTTTTRSASRGWNKWPLHTTARGYPRTK